MATRIEFRAPWSRQLRIATVWSVALLLVVLAALIAARSSVPPFAYPLVIAISPLTIAATAACMVRGYVLTEEAILVKRLGWTTRLPLAGLQSVSGDAQAMSGLDPPVRERRPVLFQRRVLESQAATVSCPGHGPEPGQLTPA